MPRGGKRIPGPGKQLGQPRVKPELPEANKAIATRVLAQAAEEEKWNALLETNDLRLRFDVLKYLTDRRDGKPTQPIRHAGAQDDEPIRVIITDVGGEAG